MNNMPTAIDSVTKGKLYANHYKIIISLCAGQVIIEEHPLSLRIPVNETAVFTCKARCEKQCNTFWVINDNHTYSENQHSLFEQMGFVFSVGRESQKLYNATLTVKATEAVNNTSVSCVFEDNDASNQSLTAILQIVAGKKEQVLDRP